jgi:tetratricopeptide (TPR) repeat protein
MKNNRVVFVFASLGALFLVLYIPKFKSKTGKNPLDRATGKTGAKLPDKPVSTDEFIQAAMPNNRPPGWVYTIITANLSETRADSLKKVYDWAANAKIWPMQQWAGMKMAEFSDNTDSMTAAARSAIWSASGEFAEIPVVSAFFFQQGKRLLDRVLQQNRKNVPALNALIVYESEYIQEPMKFLGTMRESLAIDSNNMDTNLIRFQLLLKSGQLKKAGAVSEKLISLQPQNPAWYYQASDVFGNLGDSVKSKTYLDLAVKMQKKQKN